MITWLVALIAYVIKNCTGVALREASDNSPLSTDSQELLSALLPTDALEDFTAFDPEDTLFQEFNPPSNLNSDPKAWKINRPAFKRTLWECLKTVLLIQTVAGTVIGFVAVGILFFTLSTGAWCYDEFSDWNNLPKNVIRLKITVEYIVSFIIHLFDLFCLCTIFPFSMVKNVNVLIVSLSGSFLDVIYRLNAQMFGIYQFPWALVPVNTLFALVCITDHLLIARYFYPRSLKKTLELHFMITVHYYFGIPMIYFFIYKLLDVYIKQDQHLRVITAAISPMLTVIPKVACRLAVQNLEGIVHPGRAYVFVATVYGVSAVMFRMMQAELTSIGLFIALGLVHAIIDLLERMTITMRDHIWEYLYRLVRRKRSKPPKYRSPRSRRLIADVSIQIMMQETSALVTALGFVFIYQLLYSNLIPFTNYKVIITDFLIRAFIGIFIDLVFNVVSLLIQTRVMNIAVCRVWKKKWRHHIVVNCIVVWTSAAYFGEHMFAVVKNNYDSTKHLNEHHSHNCSFPSFL